MRMLDGSNILAEEKRYIHYEKYDPHFEHKGNTIFDSEKIFFTDWQKVKLKHKSAGCRGQFMFTDLGVYVLKGIAPSIQIAHLPGCIFL